LKGKKVSLGSKEKEKESSKQNELEVMKGKIKNFDRRKQESF
jgi:hypothetical protein